MKCERTTYSCGIVIVFGSEISVEEFADDLATAAAEANATLALIFFCQETFEAEALVCAIDSHAPDLRYAGCSTAGEITPAGYCDRQILAVLFPEDRFSANAVLIEDLSTCSMDNVVTQISDMRRDMESRIKGDDKSSIFGVLLIDGLSLAEEAFTSALYWSLDNIPLIGRAAGKEIG